MITFRIVTKREEDQNGAVVKSGKPSRVSLPIHIFI